MVANKLCDNPFQTVSVQSDFNIDTYWVGYYALGMYLYSVTDWIADRAKQKGADCVHFVARDGYLPMLAYQIFKETDPTLPRDSYLYVSRKALALADVYSGKDLYSLTSKLNFTNLSPYKLEKMFVDLYKDGATSVQEELRINNAVFKTHFTNQTQFHKIIKLVGARLDEEKLAASKAELRDYFASLISQTDLIFDIGYNGRVESILSKLFRLSEQPRARSRIYQRGVLSI